MPELPRGRLQTCESRAEGGANG